MPALREIPASAITDAVAELCVSACHDLPADVEAAVRKRHEVERSPVGKEILGQILENAQLARTQMIPICQDTGLTSVILEVGQDVHVTGGDLNEAVNEGIRKGYREGLLRMSVLDHPLTRKNTGDNTPAPMHVEIVPGDKIKIMVMPKGGGCENMSQLRILKPSANAGPNACPPLMIGVGLGGSFDLCAHLAKKALFREIGSRASNPIDAQLEEELLDLANKTGLGPAGMGGDTTALAIHVESAPCHITALPVAVNVQCHAARHKEAVL
jgi:fumarate hydratase subunit alpha